MTVANDRDEPTPDEIVGAAMRQWVISEIGREPTQDEFGRMFYAWREVAEELHAGSGSGDRI